MRNSLDLSELLRKFLIISGMKVSIWNQYGVKQQK